MTDLDDIRTVIWKEWKEIFLQRGTVRRGVLAAVIVPIVALGVLMPWQEGAHWVESATTPVIWIWLPLFLVATMICDSIAGERDRHTLETLLASRLSDRAILFGKLGAYVIYGWGLAIAGLALGLVTVNAVHGHGRLLMFPPRLLAFTAVMSLMGAGLSGSAGVLISLRASSARQAQQTMSLGLMGVIFGTTFIGAGMPKPWKDAAKSYFTGSTVTTLALVAIALFAVLDVALTLAAVARFQRARLILD